MRKWAYATILSCPTQSVFAGGRVYTTGSAEGEEGPTDTPDTPFIVIRFATNQPPSPSMPGSRVRQQRFEVWVHTSPGTMLPTDDFMAELERWLPSMVPMPYDNDYIMECRWEFTSGDGYDDHYHTSTRYASFLSTYNPAP